MVALRHDHFLCPERGGVLSIRALSIPAGAAARALCRRGAGGIADSLSQPSVAIIAWCLCRLADDCADS